MERIKEAVKRLTVLFRWLRIRQYRKLMNQVEEQADITKECGVDSTCWGGK